MKVLKKAPVSADAERARVDEPASADAKRSRVDEQTGAEVAQVDEDPCAAYVQCMNSVEQVRALFEKTPSNKLEALCDAILAPWWNHDSVLADNWPWHDECADPSRADLAGAGAKFEIVAMAFKGLVQVHDAKHAAGV
jgi:hypothetical protein